MLSISRHILGLKCQIEYKLHRVPNFPLSPILQETPASALLLALHLVSGSFQALDRFIGNQLKELSGVQQLCSACVPVWTACTSLASLRNLTAVTGVASRFLQSASCRPTFRTDSRILIQCSTGATAH